MNAGGLAQFAIYPPALCHAISTRLARQVNADSRILQVPRDDFPLLALCEEDAQDTDEIAAFAVEELSDEESEEGVVAFDDANGGTLSVPLVREARKVEMQFVKDRDLYEYKPISECLAKTGHPPVSIKWVDANKGDDKTPAIRSRLVAMECRKPWKQKWFAATPPIETLRLFVDIAAVGNPRAKTRSERPRRMLLLDVSRAHWYPESLRDV